MNTRWRPEYALAIVLVAGFVTSAFVLAIKQDSPIRRDCSVRCAPRAVLAGAAEACVCAPDSTWIINVIESCDRVCGPIPFDVTAAQDGSVECKCGRPDKLRALMKRNGG